MVLLEEQSDHKPDRLKYLRSLETNTKFQPVHYCVNISEILCDTFYSELAVLLLC